MQQSTTHSTQAHPKGGRERRRLAFLAVAVLAVVVAPDQALAHSGHPHRSGTIVIASHNRLCTGGDANIEHQSFAYASSMALGPYAAANYTYECFAGWTMPAGWVLVGAQVFGGGNYCGSMASKVNSRSHWLVTTATQSNLVNSCGGHRYITVDTAAFVYNPTLGPHGTWQGGWLPRPTIWQSF